MGIITGAAIGKAVTNVVVGVGYKAYQNRKRSNLLKALENGEISVDSHELNKDEFIACYLATEEAIDKSISSAKLKALTSMFINGVASKKLFVEYEFYQEVLSIVSELSERELHVMYHLYAFSDNHSQTGESSDSLAQQQHQYLAEKMGISRDLVKALLVRLRRTGLILSESEVNDDYAPMFQTGFEFMHISQLARDVKQWIMFTVDTQQMDIPVEEKSL
ncbi:hypothetical protein [Aliivibrio sp. S10_S31]|uniref:hypothetical protein n=1 Tax=Aliivibrio sp. S10_S31 TaxID=2720224 RepID=UPI0016805CD5|nr:hypothetical protein [Aliivibrio sp. S10_S31]MBD1571539.1 hypothetical protein [Aliivibrio sp. S10_S31]